MHNQYTMAGGDCQAETDILCIYKFTKIFENFFIKTLDNFINLIYNIVTRSGTESSEEENYKLNTYCEIED